MIQRIQSVFLGISIVILTYFSIGASIISYEGNDISYTLHSNKLIASTTGLPNAETHTQFYFLGAIVLALWSIFVLLSFRNLKKQLSYARLGAFGFLAYIIIIFSSYFIGTSITDNPTVTVSFSSFRLGSYLLIVGYICYLLAISKIKKDRDLIASVDRIR